MDIWQKRRKTDGQMNRWMEGEIDRWTNQQIYIRQMWRNTDVLKYRWTDEQKGRKIDVGKSTNRQSNIDRQTNKNAKKQHTKTPITNIQTDKYRCNPQITQQTDKQKCKHIK